MKKTKRVFLWNSVYICSPRH